MFKARVLTGAVLICGVFCLAYLASNLLGLLVFTGMLFLSALEWGALAGLQSFRERLAFSSLLCGMGVFSVFVPVSLFGLSTQYLLGLSSLIIWSVIGVWIVCYQKHGFPIVRNSFGLCSLGFLVLVPFFLSIVFIWNTQPIKFLALVLIVSSVDIFAYFGGKTWGRSKFVDRVSPGKTWVGVLTGISGAFVVGNLIFFGLDEQSSNLWSVFFWNIILICTVFAAILGDLLESLVKRFGNIKNSGVVLPGHGGLLDRVDSLCAAAPAFFFSNYIFFGV